MSRSEFEDVVAAALDSIPSDLGAALDNVAIVIEEAPSPEELRDLALDPDVETLFGLYQGVSLPDRGFEYSALPDRIAIYRRPLLEACQDRAELIREIRDTVIHEIGHYFGLNEEDLP